MPLRFAPARGAASFALSSVLRGPVGPGGAAATIAVNSTSTLAAGATATVVNVGSTSAVSLDFGVPRGADAGLRFAFESSTSMAAPASGGVRFNNATLASATALAINASDAGSIDVSDFIAAWDDSTNTPKGYFVARKEGSGAVEYIYSITSVTDNTTWLQLAITYVSGAGALSAADPLYLTPLLVGNKGTDGAGTGDVVGPSSSVDSEIALFDLTTGKLIKRASTTGVLKAVSGVLSATTTSDALTIGTIELGAASDTTISRSSAGVIAVEGVTVPLNSTSSVHTASTIELGNVSDTTLSRSSAGVLAVEGVEVPLNSTSSTHIAGTIELGAATDTTLSRSAAGRLAVESKDALLKGQTDDISTAGYISTSVSAGTKSSGTYTFDPTAGSVQHATNGGAHTFAPPSSHGAWMLDYVNNGSAGTITTSGWTKVDGDAFDTTNTHAFRCMMSVGNSGSYLSVKRMV